MTRRSAILFATAAPLFVRAAAAFQGNRKRVSPHETVSVTLGGKQVTITYGRPYLKGRTFGTDVAPFGKVWRLGADEATKLTLPVDANLEGGPSLKAGSYSLWAIPQADKWTLIVNAQADVWGTRYDGSHDVGRFDLPVKKVPEVEEFTITLAAKGDNAATVTFAWGTESVSTTLTLAS